MAEYIAHKRDDGTIQSVEEHCENVAQLAGSYAKAFNNENVARTCGMLHDIGKTSQAFQKKITASSNEHVDHSTAGAQFIAQNTTDTVDAEIAEMVVASHHTGLYQYGRFETDTTTISNRVKNYAVAYSDCGASVTDADVIINAENETKMHDATVTRMLLSCLVDADRTDTQEFQENQPHEKLNGNLSDMFEKYMRYVQSHGFLEGAEGVNKLRSDVLKESLEKANTDGKFYTMTVPTGLGKTVSSCGFALSYALKHNKERIIYVVPYASIIEQTVKQLEEIFGDGCVLAHYFEASEENSEDPAKRAATENWDAPVIVTTIEQFFESLYSSNNSKLRKIHNIANSVCIFDETQTLPLPYLRPCVYKLSELMCNFGTTVVFCTATQPALAQYVSEYCPEQPIEAIEIANDYKGLYEATKRVTYENLGEIEMDQLAEEIASYEQCLTIVHTKRQAFALYDKVKNLCDDDSAIHLSTNMKVDDRLKAIQEIKRRLKDGEPCRVISTTLIQAGVDLDFPRVFTAIQGLSEIIQAGGRCNREGKRPREESIVSIFEFAGEEIPNFLKPQVGACREALALSKKRELDDPATVKTYFCRLYSSKTSNAEKDGLDEYGIVGLEQKSFAAIDFRKIDEWFRIINENNWTIFIPADECLADIAAVRNGYANKDTYRRLEKNSVNISDFDFGRLCESGFVEILDPGSRMATITDSTVYDAKTGLKFI